MTTLFRDFEGKPLCPRGSVACIGGFDGLHPGHRALLARVRERADALDAEAVAVSFEPLPREYFAACAGVEPPARLLLPRARMQGFAEAGMDRIGLLRFNAALAARSAREFVQRLLVERLAVREVWVGPGFRFGHRRQGDLALLKTLGAEFGFGADHIDNVLHEGERISATRIREWLAAGDLARAAAWLGRPYRIGGRVVRGNRLGRTLGFATANLRMRGKRPALSGVFAARVHGVADSAWPAVASLGTRPTVSGGEPLLEAHLFDFDGDLYGRRIEVEFVAKLRDEAHYPDLAALTAQMHRDAAQAQASLRNHQENGRKTA